MKAMRFISVSLVLAAAMLVSAVGAPMTVWGQRPTITKAAVILPGPISDKGWNFSGFEGLKKAAESRGVQFAYAENVGVADGAAALRDFAEKGYNPIFAHGFQFGDAAAVTAKAYPKTFFAVVHGGVENGKNLASFPTAIEDGGFLAGVLAAGWSKTKKVAVIGGVKIPPIQNAMVGFIEGVRWADPGVKVFSAWTGSFTDVALAKETARSFIAQGADVTFMETNESNVGIISAAEETKTFAIGYAMDQSSVGPNSVLTSTMIHFPVTYGWVIDAVKENRFDGKSRKMGLREKVVQLAPFHSFEGRISPELRKKMNEAATLLVDKKVNALPAK